MTYLFEARYRGVPRQAAVPVREYLRGLVDVPGSSVKDVRAVILDSRGFRVRLHLRHNPGVGQTVGAIQAGNTVCAMALEAARQQGKLGDADMAAYCISCELIA
jgi:hypothetical protein